MLSYRHGFHAGNHADVLKHFIFVQLLRHMAKKDKPFWCIDTHAGAALYSLESTYARKHSEFENGIARLWAQKILPEPLEDYVAQVRQHNPDGKLRYYPGSPQLGLQMLRRSDRLRLFELHTTESRVLEEYFSKKHIGAAAQQVMVKPGDGFNDLKSILPPVPRRGVILIDPSYEDKNDYRRVLITLREGLERFPTGTYMIWYPQVQRREAQQLPAALMRNPDIEWLHVSLSVKHPQEDGFGLHGSGVYIVNPPYTLLGMLRKVMPFLVQILAQDNGARFTLDKQLK